MAGVISLLRSTRLRRQPPHLDTRVHALHALVDRALQAGVTIGEIESEITALLDWAKRQHSQDRPLR